MGPVGLFLAAEMSKEVDLSPGCRIMDLACGTGTTSAFFAKHFDTQVSAVDLWVKPDVLARKFEKLGVADKVCPFNVDVTESTPFPQGHFDTIFCMGGTHYFEGTVDFAEWIAALLRPSGVLCVGSPCFNRELTAEELGDLPLVYDDGSDV